MGYTTEFKGAFKIEPPLSPEHAAYLRKFSETRRMKRDAVLAASLPDLLRLAVGLPVGDEGAFYVGSDSDHGQAPDASVIDQNQAPGLPSYGNPLDFDAWSRQKEAAIADNAQPGLWCQWVPGEDGATLEWDQGEKFSEYVAWIRYLIRNMLKPWGYSLNGEVSWLGEDADDRGVIYCCNNEVEAVADRITNPGPSWGRRSVACEITLFGQVVNVADLPDNSHLL